MSAKTHGFALSLPLALSAHFSSAYDNHCERSVLVNHQYMSKSVSQRCGCLTSHTAVVWDGSEVASELTKAILLCIQQP